MKTKRSSAWSQELLQRLLTTTISMKRCFVKKKLLVGSGFLDCSLVLKNEKTSAGNILIRKGWKGLLLQLCTMLRRYGKIFFAMKLVIIQKVLLYHISWVLATVWSLPHKRHQLFQHLGYYFQNSGFRPPGLLSLVILTFPRSLPKLPLETIYRNLVIIYQTCGASHSSWVRQ